MATEPLTRGLEQCRLGGPETEKVVQVLRSDRAGVVEGERARVAPLLGLTPPGTSKGRPRVVPRQLARDFQGSSRSASSVRGCHRPRSISACRTEPTPDAWEGLRSRPLRAAAPAGVGIPEAGLRNCACGTSAVAAVVSDRERVASCARPARLPSKTAAGGTDPAGGDRALPARRLGTVASRRPLPAPPWADRAPSTARRGRGRPGARSRTK